MSVDKVLNMAKTVTTISVYMPQNKKHLIKTMPMKRQEPIAKLFEEEFRRRNDEVRCTESCSGTMSTRILSLRCQRKTD